MGIYLIILIEQLFVWLAEAIYWILEDVIKYSENGAYITIYFVRKLG